MTESKPDGRSARCSQAMPDWPGQGYGAGEPSGYLGVWFEQARFTPLLSRSVHTVRNYLRNPHGTFSAMVELCVLRVRKRSRNVRDLSKMLQAVFNSPL
ncbi:hypothetical protein N8703_04780 [Verrucomicrobia bacterium]|nr:hypothetical protein [Verrucomicrobiota bacterium]